MTRFWHFQKPKWVNLAASAFSWTPCVHLQQFVLPGTAAQLKLESQNHSVLNCYIYAQMLKSYIRYGNLSAAEAIHCHTVKKPCLDLFAQNILLDAYVKLGSLSDAFRMFDELPEKNTVSFVTMIQGCSQRESFSSAVQLFCQLHKEGHELNPHVFTVILKLLSILKFIQFGQCVHSCILRLGYESHTYVGTSLIEIYSICSLISDARAVFDGILEKDLVSWTGMVTCYADSGNAVEAVNCFSEMARLGLEANNFTIFSLLKASVMLQSLTLGRIVHGLAMKTKYISDPHVSTALLVMYMNCEGIDKAYSLFESLPVRDVVLWSSMISMYKQANQNEEALGIFKQMRGFYEPSYYSFCSVLQACANMSNLRLGEQIHGHLLRTGLDSEVFIANTLMDIYAKGGKIVSCLKVFSQLEQKTEVSWNTIIVGHVQLGFGEDALLFFCEMHATLIPKTRVSYSSALRACATLATLEQSTQIHSLIVKSIYNNDMIVVNALIDAYAKCGSIKRAQKVFDTMEEHNVISWNALITGYSLHGMGMDALNLFARMREATYVVPDKITFVGILSACSNNGLVKEGKYYYNCMTDSYGIKPTIEHYNCMVKLLGRSGDLCEAMKFIEEMPLEPNALLWRSFLGACVSHKNVELGLICARKVLELDPHDESAHVLLANMYTTTERWKDVSLVRRSMRMKGVRKEPAFSWIEIQNKIHAFTASDTSHPDIRVINAMLEWLRRKIVRAGYITHENAVLHEAADDEKKQMLWMHSERLAFAYAHLVIAHGRPVRIIKNLRCCTDCHATFKLVSSVVQREVIVRDMNRFHHFRDGICSCGDYW